MIDLVSLASLFFDVSKEWPTIFTDRLSELVLVHLPSTATPS